MSDTISQCPAVLRELGLIPRTELSTLVVGSTARGWDHSTSDTDVVVISTEPFADSRAVTMDVPLSPGTVPTVVFHRDGRRWEVKFWLDGQVDQMFEKITWERFERGGTVGSQVTQAEVVFLSRLRTCATVSGAQWVRDRREQLDQSAFRSILLTQVLTDADHAAEAAIGQLSAGESEGAVYLARQAFDLLVEAILIDHGEYEVGIKWRARRFRTAAPRQLTFDRYWAIETMRDYQPDKPGLWVEQVVGLCKDLSIEVEL
jgi:hypothetical protein